MTLIIFVYFLFDNYLHAVNINIINNINNKDMQIIFDYNNPNHIHRNDNKYKMSSCTVTI